MKLQKVQKTEQFHEVEVEYSFLFFKWITKYRKVGNMIYTFKEPNIYGKTGFSEHIYIAPFFTLQNTI